MNGQFTRCSIMHDHILITSASANLIAVKVCTASIHERPTASTKPIATKVLSCSQPDE